MSGKGFSLMLLSDGCCCYSFDIRKCAQSVFTGNLIRHLRDAHNIQEAKKPGQQSTLENFMQVDRRAKVSAKEKDKRWHYGTRLSFVVLPLAFAV